jgi:hypothetical protein
MAVEDYDGKPGKPLGEVYVEKHFRELHPEAADDLPLIEGHRVMTEADIQERSRLAEKVSSTALRARVVAGLNGHRRSPRSLPA